MIIFLTLIFVGCNSGDPYIASSRGTMAIVKVSPIENAANVPVNSSVSITFEKAIDTRTLNRATVKLSSISGSTVPGNISYDPSTKIATYTPVVSMQEGTHYELTVSEVKGANQEFLPPHVFHFTTAQSFFMTRYNPQNNESSVKVIGLGKQDIFVQFNQSVDATKVSTANFYAVEQSNSSMDFENIMPASIVYDDTLKQLILKPQRGRLKFSTDYFVVLRDIMSANNALLDGHTWNFSTEQIRVNASEPSSNAINISTSTEIGLFFQGAVDRATIAGNIKLRKAFGIQEQFFFVGQPSFESGDTKIILKTRISASDPALENNTRYEIIVDGVLSTSGERFKEFRSFFTTE